jgi:hypothetical protein
MKTIIVSLLCLLLTSHLFGQPDGWYFSFNLGGSWPVGEFAGNTSGDLKSGYAQNGFSLSLDAVYPVSENISLKGMVFLNNNPVDKLAIYNQLVNRMVQYFPIEATDEQFITMTVNPWVWNGILAGPVYTITFKKLLWDFQVMGGLNVAYLPQQKLIYDNPGNNWHYIHQNLNSVNVSYGLMAGTAVRYPVSDKIYLRLGVDYYNSRASLKYEELRVINEGSTTVTEQLGAGTSVVPIENISGTIGFVYYLN